MPPKLGVRTPNRSVIYLPRIYLKNVILLAIFAPKRQDFALRKCDVFVDVNT